MRILVGLFSIVVVIAVLSVVGPVANRYLDKIRSSDSGETVLKRILHSLIYAVAMFPTGCAYSYFTNRAWHYKSDTRGLLTGSLIVVYILLIPVFTTKRKKRSEWMWFLLAVGVPLVSGYITGELLSMRT